MCPAIAAANTAVDYRSTIQFRRPVSLVTAGERLLVANRRSGSISVIDPSRGQVLCESPIGTQLSELIALPAADSFLALDESSGQAIQLRLDGSSPRVVQRLAVGTSPVTACAWPDGHTCSIALLWAHQLAIVEYTRGDSDSAVKLHRTIDLPFAPRKQWVSPDGKTLVVADSFGGTVALIDLPGGTILGYRCFDANNIRGMAASPNGREIWISQSMLDPVLSTEREHVFWGQLMGNFVRSVELNHFLNCNDIKASDPLTPRQLVHWSLFPLGVTNNGAGDPDQMVLAPDGTLLVCLAGVDEIGFRAPGAGGIGIIDVGRRPTALALSHSRRQLYVANTLDDSISVIDLTTRAATATILLGPGPQPTAADRGESLFYDARLSLDNWYSCNSCHTDGHTCNQLNDNLSDGTFGTPKRILSLLGTADTGPWAWNGSNATLEQQIHTSIRSTMQGKPEAATDAHIADLAAYLRTLKPPPSLDAARDRLDIAAIARGQKVFDRLGCAACHAPPTYTSAQRLDVGLADERGHKRFNPPSLRGLTQRPAFFHDNRAVSLTEVFTRYHHPDGQPMASQDLQDLIAFLQSL